MTVFSVLLNEREPQLNFSCMKEELRKVASQHGKGDYLSSDSTEFKFQKPVFHLKQDWASTVSFE